MSGRGRLGLAVAVCVIAGAIAGVVVLLDRGHAHVEVQQPPGPIGVAGTLTPRAILFGDTVVARIDVAVDRRRIDPASVRVSAGFAPFAPTGDPSRDRRDTGNLTLLRFELPIRCATTTCLPHGTKRVVLSAARVTYRAPTGATRTLAVAWPALDVYSRLDPVELATADRRTVPAWRGDPTTVPAVSYAIDPDLLRGLLLGGGILLLLAAAGLGVRLLPRSVLATVGPQPRPVPLTPLEQALLVFETARARRPVGDQRKALELLARALDSDGEPPLALQARELAWSQPGPAAEPTKALTTSIRQVIEERKNGHGA